MLLNCFELIEKLFSADRVISAFIYCYFRDKILCGCSDSLLNFLHTVTCLLQHLTLIDSSPSKEVGLLVRKF